MSSVERDWPVETGVLDLGDLPVERGGTISNARLSWQTRWLDS